MRYLQAHRRDACRFNLCALFLLLIALAACGVKGPPLPPEDETPNQPPPVERVTPTATPTPRTAR